MSRELNQKVLDCVLATRMPDYDQRSALGIVRSSLDSVTGELNVWHPHKHEKQIQYPMRDQLAKDIAALLVGEKKSEAIKALAYARAAINKPFQNPEMNGARNPIAKPGAAKKAREAAAEK